MSGIAEFSKASCAWLLFEFESLHVRSKVVAGDEFFYTQPGGSELTVRVTGTFPGNLVDD